MYKANPTLATGDVTISKDGGAFANMGTLPAVAPASGRQVTGLCTATEMTADIVTIVFHDQTVPPEWSDLSFSVLTTS